MSEKEFYNCYELEALTGTPAATWRYWAKRGEGPASIKLGRRRVWKKSTVRQWLKDQEKASQ